MDFVLGRLKEILDKSGAVVTGAAEDSIGDHFGNNVGASFLILSFLSSP